MCRAARVAPALLGSLVLVALLREAAEVTEKPAYIVGFNLADFMKEGFIAVAALLGALGSFFSGSTTVSNLTFGIVHQVRAAPCCFRHALALPSAHNPQVPQCDSRDIRAHPN